MSEQLGGSVREANPYCAPQPFTRNHHEKNAWRETQHLNRVLTGKLENVAREPPANFHAPLGYTSLKQGPAMRAAKGGKPASTMPCTQHHVDVPPYPIPRPAHATSQRSKEQRRIDSENSRLAVRLMDLYGSQAPRAALNPGGVYQEAAQQQPGVDCSAAWAQRTALYVPHQLPRTCPLSPQYRPPDYAPSMQPSRQGSGQAPDSQLRQQLLAAASYRHEQSGVPGAQVGVQTSLGSWEQAPSIAEAAAGHSSPPSPAAHAINAGHLDPAPSQSGAAEQCRNVLGLWPGQGRNDISGNPSPKQSRDVGPRPGSAHIAGSRPKSASAAERVPKTLGLAACAGCGARGFSKADGVHLEPCKHCHQVWYCSEVCARVDWVSHKAVCKWHTTGHSLSYGKKPAQDHWVANQSLAVAREALRKRGKEALAAGTIAVKAATVGPSGGLHAVLHKLHSYSGAETSIVPPGVAVTPSQARGLYQSAVGIDQGFTAADEVLAMVKAARARELAAERRQKDVETRAYWGLDGPRPCLFSNGKPM